MLFKVYFNMQSDNEILEKITVKIEFCHIFWVPLFKWKSYSAPVIAMHLATLRVLQNSDDISIHKKKRLSIALIVTTEQRKNDLICYYSSQH